MLVWLQRKNFWLVHPSIQSGKQLVIAPQVPRAHRAGRLPVRRIAFFLVSHDWLTGSWTNLCANPLVPSDISYFEFPLLQLFGFLATFFYSAQEVYTQTKIASKWKFRKLTPRTPPRRSSSAPPLRHLRATCAAPPLRLTPLCRFRSSSAPTPLRRRVGSAPVRSGAHTGFCFAPALCSGSLTGVRYCDVITHFLHAEDAEMSETMLPPISRPGTYPKLPKPRTRRQP